LSSRSWLRSFKGFYGCLAHKKTPPRGETAFTGPCDTKNYGRTSPLLSLTRHHQPSAAKFTLTEQENTGSLNPLRLMFAPVYSEPPLKSRKKTIAVRLRLNKKVQNLNEMWYESFAKHIAT
jgi:hypothetical protein